MQVSIYIQLYLILQSTISMPMVFNMSQLFILYFICSSSLSAISDGSDEFLKVPLPLFKNSMEYTIKVVQNVSSLMSNIQTHHDLQLSQAISNCLELLGSTTDLLNRSLSTVQDPQGGRKYYGTGNVGSDMATWLSGALGNQATCMEEFEGMSSASLAKTSFLTKSLDQVTELVTENLNEVKLHGGSSSRSERDIETFINGFEQPLYFRFPNVTVAQDGSGNFTKIMDAVLAAPNWGQKYYVIFVKRGVYQEYVQISRHKWNLVMIGEGMHLTVVSGDRSYGAGWKTFYSATFAIYGDGFIAMNMGFENTAGPQMHQAVALRSSSDLSGFFRCMISGYQDTLYIHRGRQFYKECRISGTIDFIFGRHGTAVFQNCPIIARRNVDGGKNTITAHGQTNSTNSTGFSFQFCTISADRDLTPQLRFTPTYLGRPWGIFSRTIFMQSYMSNVVMPEGWLEWNGTLGLDTLFYGEYMNNGPGAAVGGRVQWPGYHVITNSLEADLFTVAKFIEGHAWLPSTGIPYIGGLKA